MEPVKVVIQRNIKTVIVKTNGVKWQSGGGSAVTADNVSAAIDGFTVESNPQKTQYVALGGKKKSLISALIALWKGDFDTYYAAINHNHSGVYQPAGDYATHSDLVSKVDKESGKGLSQENYTTAEKSKLSSLESSHYKGRFTNLSALQTAIPTATAGDYARVDGGVGVDVVTYIWDDNDNKWVQEKGTGTTETAASVKTKYESNPDTNVFDDAAKSKLASITAIFTTALKTTYDNAATWVSTYGSSLLAHLTNTSNPHSTTAAQVGALATVARDNSLKGDGAGTPLGVNSLFDKVRLMGAEYCEDFSVPWNTSTLPTTKGFGVSAAGSGSFSNFNSFKLTAISGASTYSGAYIAFTGVGGSIATLLTWSIGYFKRTDALIKVTAASVANKLIRVGPLSSASSAIPAEGVYIEFLNGNIYAKTAKSSVEYTVATLITGYSLNTSYRCVVDSSNPASINFYVYDSSNNLLASANTTTNIPSSSALTPMAMLLNVTNAAGTVIGECRAIGVIIQPLNL